MRPCPAALVSALLLAAPAAAAPLAALTADVNSDGAPVAVTIEADGALHVGGATVPLGPGATRATLAVAPVRGKPAVLVHLTSPRGAEAVIVARGAGGWQVAWRGEVGGQGLDAEYAIDVTATPGGMVRHQTRGDVRRCDGKPALLFAEDFDGARFVAAQKLPVDVAPTAPLLVARVDPQRAERPQLYQARAASLRAGAADAGALAIPRELDDGDPATAWRADGAAIGQFVTFQPRGDDQARQLRVMAGDHGSKAKLEGANRPRELAIVGASGAWRVELPDAAREPLDAAYVVDLPEPVAGCVTVVIASTYGARATTAISELALYADGERANGGLAALAHTVAIDGPGAQTKAQQLAQGGGAAAAAIDAELAKTATPAARRRLTRVLVQLHDPAAAPLLVRAALAGWVDGDELVAVARALGAAHQAHELRELASSHDLALDVRIAAAQALDPGHSDELAALIELAGVGPRALRRAIIERLQAAPAAALVAAAQAQTTPAAAGDLWRAAVRAAHQRPAERAPVLAAITAALPSADDYERRYRFVDGIAALGDAPALAALTGWLAALPAGAEAAALRQVAARALGKAPRPEAVDLVIALVRDRDAGVRLAALAALMQAGDDAAGAAGPWHSAAGADAIDRVIGEPLARDAWPDVRVRAAQALGARCARPGPAGMLATAATGDPALAVRAEALIALVECRAPGAAALLARTWSDAKAPLALRTRAVGLTVALGDRALGEQLVRALAGWRGDTLESPAALALAVSAASAVGKAHAPGADAALQDALDDSAFPEIVGAAAAGLGALGPACSPASKAKLGALARSDDPQISGPARFAAKACGAPSR